MEKQKELADPKSCLNRAKRDELIFVLRGHDIAAPDTIRAWARLRVRMELNRADDSQIREALDCANEMDRRRLR